MQDGTPTPTPTPENLVPTPGWLPPWIPGWTVRVAVALVVIGGTFYISRLVKTVLGRRIARRFRRPSVVRTVLRSVQAAILVAGGLLTLNVLGIPIGDLAISLSVFSAVLGFVLAPIIGSVINGFFVLSERPYEIGDMVQLVDTDTYGFVEDITLRYTKIFTLNNTFLIVPNGTIRERDVINYSAEDARTRLALDLLVTYESDIDQARAIAEEAARKVDNVIEGGPDIRVGGARYPAAPTCYIDAFADHGVSLRLRYWVTEPYKLLTARSKVQTNFRELMMEADVEIAYPHSHLYFDETSGEMQVSMRQRGPEEGPTEDSETVSDEELVVSDDPKETQ